MTRANRSCLSLSPWRAERRLAGMLLLLWSASGCADESVAGGARSGDDAGADQAAPPEGIEICDPVPGGPFTLELDHPYLPFSVGKKHTLEGNEAGAELVRFEIEVLDETRSVAGVETRVVQKTNWVADEVSTVELAFYAQVPDGTVCFFGEQEDLYIDGVATESEAVTADEDEFRASIAMPADPEVGLIFINSYDDEGIGRAEVTHVGVEADTPAGLLRDTITVVEDGPSIKKYARDIGEIFDDGIVLIDY